MLFIWALYSPNHTVWELGNFILGKHRNGSGDRIMFARLMTIPIPLDTVKVSSFRHRSYSTRMKVFLMANVSSNEKNTPFITIYQSLKVLMYSKRKNLSRFFYSSKCLKFFDNLLFLYNGRVVVVLIQTDYRWRVTRQSGSQLRNRRGKKYWTHSVKDYLINNICGPSASYP